MISELISLLRLPVLWHVRYVGWCMFAELSEQPVGSICKGPKGDLGFPEGLITNDQVRICNITLERSTQLRKHDLT